MKEICEFPYNIIIDGDFNIDWSKERTYKNTLKCAFNDNGRKQIVTDYTRVTASAIINNKTIINYVITNNTNITAHNNISNKITDHEVCVKQ